MPVVLPRPALRPFIGRLWACTSARRPAPLGALAYGAGYSDQAHMTRGFRGFAGVTPSQYRLPAPAAAHHVELPGPQAGQIHSRQAGIGHP